MFVRVALVMGVVALSLFVPGFSGRPVAADGAYHTTPALSSSINPSAPGQAVTFSATITEGGATNPTGTVTFRDGSTTLGTSTVTSSGGVGHASITTASLTAGSHPITAIYSGDANDQSSSSNADKQVVGSPTAALVSAFHAFRQGSHAIFLWRMAILRDVSGFNVYAGTHKLNAHAIGVHPALRYSYTHRWVGNSSFSLHVLLTNGQEVVISAGLSGIAKLAAIADRRIQAHG